MHIAIIGAGVIGVTSAYYLVRKGYAVTVIDARSQAAGGASHANGGQLSYSFSEALGNPEFIRSLPGVLAGRDPGAKAALSLGLMGWGLRLLRHSSRASSEMHSLATYRAALRSKDLLDALRDETAVEFEFRKAGKLVCLPSAQAARRAEAAIKMKMPFGCDNVVISGREALDIEPALASFRTLPETLVYSPGDEVGDARQFVRSLQNWLQAHSECRFVFDTDVRSVITERQRAIGVATDHDDLECDAVVIAAGVGSPKLVRPFGIRLPIRAMRGYSVSLPRTDTTPNVSITAAAEHFVFSRLGDSLRVAGFADFADSTSASRIRARTDELLRIAHHIAPGVGDFETAEKHRWSGVRPMTPNSQPIIGSTAVNGLFINSGHGMLGWTLACASGETLSTEISRSLKR